MLNCVTKLTCMWGFLHLLNYTTPGLELNLEICRDTRKWWKLLSSEWESDNFHRSLPPIVQASDYTAFCLIMQVKFFKVNLIIFTINWLLTDYLKRRESNLFPEDLVWYFVYNVWQHFDLCVEVTVQFDYASDQFHSIYVGLLMNKWIKYLYSINETWKT